MSECFEEWPAPDPGDLFVPAGPGDEPEIETPWWLTDEFYGSDQAEYHSWLRTLPADIRADYESGPWTGAGEAFAAGFLHHDREGAAGDGFAAGGHYDELPAGLELAAATAQRSDAGPATLGESELIGVLCAWQRLAAWAQAGQASAIIALADRRVRQSADLKNPHLAEHTGDEIAAALRLTGVSAGRLLTIAAGLKRLPAVLGALRAGRIDWAKVCVFTDLLDALDADVAAGIAGDLLDRASMLTTGQLRAALLRKVMAADPAAADRRKKAARKDTSVQFWHEMSGNAVLSGRELKLTDALHADLRLSALARWLRKNGAPQPLAQLRAEVFVALLTGKPVVALLPEDHSVASPVPSGPAPASGFGGLTGWPDIGVVSPAMVSGSAQSQAAACCTPAVTGTINLTMPMSAFLGGSATPGELAGFGPVDAASCRDLIAAADPATRWCLTLTDTGGRAVAHACARHGPVPGTGLRWAADLRGRLQVLESGTCGHQRRTPGYRPAESLRHLIEIRQPACSAPGCRRASKRCDLDHALPYDQGGLTCECNLHPCCRHHHRAKQAPGWGVREDQPGVLTWQLPHDRTYQTVPDTYPV